MNLETTEFYPSNDARTRLPVDAEDRLSTCLTTDCQIDNARSILEEWNTSTTLSTLLQEWSARHDILRPIHRVQFSLMLYNISSLQVHLAALIQYICSSYPTIWALTGLHFNENVNYQLASFFKSRYTIYYQQGTNRFGGVCLAIAREVPHRILSEFNQIANLIVVDMFNKNKRYAIAVLYSPPTEDLPITTLNRLYEYKRKIILIGDLNARHPHWHDVNTNPKGCRFDEWIDEKENLRVYNAPQPTSTRSQAVIDLVIAPQHLSSELTKIDQTMQATDHYPVPWDISSLILNNTNQYEVKRLDWTLINCILHLKQNFFFSLAEQMKNEPTAFILLYERFLVALQERCTTYHITKQYRPSLPPYFVNVIKQRRQILHLYRSTRSQEHRDLLRCMNRYIHYELRAIKKAQWQDFYLGLEPKNTKRFWNHTKSLFKKREPRIQGFVDGTEDQILTEPDAMIKHAYQYYSSAFKETETPFQSQKVAEFKRHLPERLTKLPSKPFLFKISNLTRAIHRLKTKTSSGHKKVSNKLLKSIPISHYGFLLQTFNRLLVDNKYPPHWKLSKMILLPKEKSTILSVDKTRPISLLPCLGKVYERCFLVYLLRWMSDSGILPPEQSRFRAQHSTMTRFVKFLEDISTGLLQQTAALVIYVDFTKAFDQLWHDGLIYKLHKMNCPQELVTFIIEYLKNRKCYIELNQLISDIFDIEKGVPQGSCLGPILFLLFHCEMVQKIPSATHKHLFADDLGLAIIPSPWWRRSEFTMRMQQLGQRVLNEVQIYADQWKQPINCSKTEWQWIHRRVCMPSLTLTIGQHTLKRTSLFKYLGNYVDDRFSFNKNCTKMLEKVQANSVLLKYVARSKTSSLKARQLVFKAFILPYPQLIYAIWPLLSTSTIERIEAKNRQLYRIVHNWWDATNHEAACLPGFETVETKAQRFLRRFIDKAAIVSPELFEDYILSKAMPMYMRMHLEEPFIDALPRGRLNNLVRAWINNEHTEHWKCYLDRLSILLNPAN